MHLRVAQVVPRTEAEGPGQRFAVWVQGCTLRCVGCCNPEMFPREGGERVAVRELARRVARTVGIEGISLLGGEPFEQAEACARFARLVGAAGLSVTVFTGYTRAELDARRGAAGVADLLSACDLLVDGRFDSDRSDASRRWVGSSNQVVHFLTPRYSASDPRFFATNTAEIRLSRGELTMNGWPGLVPELLRKARRLG